MHAATPISAARSLRVRSIPPNRRPVLVQAIKEVAVSVRLCDSNNPRSTRALRIENLEKVDQSAFESLARQVGGLVARGRRNCSESRRDCERP